MFGYIEQLDSGIVQEAVCPLAAAVEDDAKEQNETGTESRFWRWWMSLYCPNSRPTTAGL